MRWLVLNLAVNIRIEFGRIEADSLSVSKHVSKQCQTDRHAGSAEETILSSELCLSIAPVFAVLIARLETMSRIARVRVITLLFSVHSQQLHRTQATFCLFSREQSKILIG